jgi:deoxyribose-phosphate aldolase
MLFKSIDDVAQLIDHTNLKPNADQQQITSLCEEAVEYKFKTVCVNPFWVPFSDKILSKSSVKVCTVIGFPLGANTTSTKVHEAQTAVQQGAQELDMVVNISALKSNNYDYVRRDIEAVVNSVKPNIVKTIIEICFLTNEEIVKVSNITKQSGAAFVKTSTGFGSGGATVEAVKLIRETVGPHMGLKAAGGIRTFTALRQMVKAGATRIGASSGIQIINQAKKDLAEPKKG